MQLCEWCVVLSDRLGYLSRYRLSGAVEQMEKPDSDATARLNQELTETQTFLRILFEIVEIADKSTKPESFIEESLKLICLEMNRPLANAWFLNTTSNQLGWCATTDLTKIQTKEFIEATQNSHFKPGTGLPGRALAESESVWISNLSVENNFPRLQVAAKCGLKSAFAFAVKAGGKTIAVFEFFSRHTEPFNPNTTKFLTRLGNYLGLILDCKIKDSERPDNGGRK